MRSGYGLLRRHLNSILAAEEQRALRSSARHALAMAAIRIKLVLRRKGEKIVWSGRHACHVRVTGRVQGIFFRAWARDQAKQLGVGGWIRNSRDGSVEAHLEGSRDALQKLSERLRVGPPGARVDQLQINGADVKDLNEFEVRH